MLLSLPVHLFFFLNDPAPTEIYSLPLHDPLPIFVFVGPETSRSPLARRNRYASLSSSALTGSTPAARRRRVTCCFSSSMTGDRKSTRLNSSHVRISYAVFCLTKQIVRTLARDRST